MLFPYGDINPTRRIPFFTWLLIGANVAAFVYLYLILMPAAGPEQIEALVNSYNGCPADIEDYISEPSLSQRFNFRFFLLHGLVPANITASIRSIERFFTHMFLHGGISHLVGNMLFFWVTGDNLEDRFGHVPFLLFYLFCGLAAAGTQIAMNPSACKPMVGASGAIAGTMGGYMVLFPRSKIKVFYIFLIYYIPIFGRFLIHAFIWLGLWILFQFLLEYVIQNPGGVAHWAHIGGFLSGAAITLVARMTGFAEGGVASDLLREQRRQHQSGRPEAKRR